MHFLAIIFFHVLRYLPYSIPCRSVCPSDRQSRTRSGLLPVPAGHIPVSHSAGSAVNKSAHGIFWPPQHQMVIMCPPFGVLLSCFHRSSSRPFHEPVQHRHSPVIFHSFLMAFTAVCIYCCISEFITSCAPAYSIFTIISACVAVLVILHFPHPLSS